MHDTQCRLQSEFHPCPIKRVFDVRGLGVGIGEKVRVEIRQVRWQGLGIGQHIGELLGYHGRVTLIVIKSQGLIALMLVGEQTLQCRLLQESIHLFVHIGGRPIDGSVKVFDRAGRQLHLTVAGRAVLQGLDLIAVERKIFQVRKCWRIAEHLERQIAGKLTTPVEIAGKLNVALRSSVDVDRTKQEDFGRRAGGSAFTTGYPLRMAAI